MQPKAPGQSILTMNHPCLQHSRPIWYILLLIYAIWVENALRHVPDEDGHVIREMP